MPDPSDVFRRSRREHPGAHRGHATVRARPTGGAASRSDPPYTSPAMNVTATPAPKSSVILEVEVPAERLDRAVGEAVRALSRRTRVPGFRPGKAPRGVLEARPRPRRRPRRGRRPARPGRLPRRAHRAGDPAADQRRRRDRPGRGGQAADLQGDRPGPARGRARRLQELQLPARDRDDRRRRRSTRSSRSCATRTRPSRRSRTAAPRRATTRSSSTRAAATASRSTAARPSGCR